MNARSNFDNLLIATLTLFEMMTTEGWMAVMYSGMDMTQVDMQPKLNSSSGWSVFFVAFMIVGNMFILNLFVGVVIDKFNRMKDKLCGFLLMTDYQRSWVEM